MTPPEPAEPTEPVRTIPLDPTGADHHGEAARLRQAGPVVRVILPGNVSAWAITRHDLLTDLVRDPRVSKDWRNWTAVKNGEIPDGWPLIGMLKVTNMVTADGDEHLRLRKLVSRTFTGSRVQAMRPRITGIVDTLLDELPANAGPDGTVDLRRHLAYPVPMTVICDLLGVPDAYRRRFRELVDSIFCSTTTPDQVLATQRGRHLLLSQLIDLRRRQPGDDLTTALLAARDQDPDALSDEELIDTLWLLLTAGHETTLSLITNAVRALLTHPAQLDIALAGKDHPSTWEAVVEETLRWDAPIGNFMARYPMKNITIAGVTIPAGDAILAPYSAVGRDPQQHGPTAGRFDITRRPAPKHLAFGGGPHICLGAHLARAEATITLARLFGRYPDLTLEVPPGGLSPVPSLFSNSATTLPVRLGASATAVADPS